MSEKIKNEIIPQKSKNYIAPTKANVINGCKKCYMDPNYLDEEMAVYDDKYEVFQEGFKFKPLPQHVQESDQEDGIFSYWHWFVV